MAPDVMLMVDWTMARIRAAESDPAILPLSSLLPRRLVPDRRTIPEPQEILLQCPQKKALFVLSALGQPCRTAPGK